MNPFKALIYLSFAAPVWAQYAGPAILSRGEAPAAMAAPDIDFRPFLTVAGTYDTGLAGVSVNSQGQLASTASYGIQFAGGISGTHSWKHTKIGLDLSAAVNDYTQQTYFDSATYSLALGIIHQFSRHIVLNLRENAGMFSQNFTSLGLPQSVPFDSSQSYVPVSDFFDNRTIYLTSQADVIYQRNSRLSFDFGGDVFIDRYRSSALFGMTGEGARGDVQYRVTRRSTIGAQYGYQHYSYSHLISGTDVHTLSLSYSTRVGRWWEFSAFGGAARVESKFVQVIPLDPVVAQLLGVSSGIATVYNKQYIPVGSGRLSRTFHRGVFYVTGGRVMMPGNGLFLATKMTSASMGYTYTGFRHWSFTAQVLYDRGESEGNIAGTYGDVSGALSVSRSLVKNIHFVAGAEARRYQSPTYTQYNRNIYDAHIGFGWTPGPFALRLW